MTKFVVSATVLTTAHASIGRDAAAFFRDRCVGHGGTAIGTFKKVFVFSSRPFTKRLATIYAALVYRSIPPRFGLLLR